MVVKSPKSHNKCLLCGCEDNLGLNLRFISLSSDTVMAEVDTSSKHQGYSGILHGGFITSLLDSAMCHALFQIGIEAVTGDMKISFHKEIACNSKLILKGQVINDRGPLYKTKAWIEADGVTCATSTARFVKRKSGKL